MGHLAKVEAGAESIARSNEFINEHLKGIDYSAVKRGGMEGSSTEIAALTGADELTNNLAEFAHALDQVRAWSRRLDFLRVKAETNWTDDAKNAASFVAKKENGEGDCVNCGRYVPGTRVDRLRNDRCEACARYWSRHNREKERPRHLWPGDSIDDRCTAIRTHLGTGYRCVLEWGHGGNHESEVGSFQNPGRVA